MFTVALHTFWKRNSLEFGIVTAEGFFMRACRAQIMDHDGCLIGLEGSRQFSPAFIQVIFRTIYIVGTQIFLQELCMQRIVNRRLSFRREIIGNPGVGIHQHFQRIGAAGTAADTQAIAVFGPIRELGNIFEELIPGIGQLEAGFLEPVRAQPEIPGL
ncbi:hypothetical protein D3C74_357690 [compost metagenome]